MGYAAYAGANAFLDAFAARERRNGRRDLISVDWDQWEIPGRVATGAAAQAARQGATLKPVDGIVVFERVLRLLDLDRVVVSTLPLATSGPMGAPPAAGGFRGGGGTRPDRRSRAPSSRRRMRSRHGSRPSGRSCSASRPSA
jgi:hypothetical protein